MRILRKSVSAQRNKVFDTHPGNAEPLQVRTQLSEFVKLNRTTIFRVRVRLESVQPSAGQSLDTKAPVVQFVATLSFGTTAFEPPSFGSKFSKSLSIFTGIVLASLPNRTELLGDPSLVSLRDV